MKKKTMGIHHITAIVGHPQENVDFYAGVLGLRLVKQTVNFDDPGTYHLYFGNEGGKPGTIITFFPWAGARQGIIGDGQVGVQPSKTAELLEKVLGLEFVGQEGDIARYRSLAEIGNIIDLKLTTIGLGQMGVGTVHHIAWRAADDDDQLVWKKYVESNGYGVTPVQDRNYFNAIYFREHGKILFEIATDPPGFAHDESQAAMGEKLMLPSQFEPHREKLERGLIPFEVRELD
jgi:glyoxalase family protein